MRLALDTQTAILVLITCLLGSCKTNAAQEPSESAAGKPTTNAALAEELGISCKDAAKGEGCIQGDLDVGDYYDIELAPKCTGESLLGGVVVANSKLLDTTPYTGSNAQIVALLAASQLVCVQATARVRTSPPSYYYVSAISRENAACRNRGFCLRFGARSIRYLARLPENQACSASIKNDFIDDCAHGWIDSDLLEVSSER